MDTQTFHLEFLGSRRIAVGSNAGQSALRKLEHPSARRLEGLKTFIALSGAV
jgi:hypothetical protein